MNELLVQEIENTVFTQTSAQLEQCKFQLQKQTEELERLKSERDWLEAQLQAWIQTAQKCIQEKAKEFKSSN